MSTFFHTLLSLNANRAQIPDYLCFTALESGTFTLSIPAGVPSTYLSYVEYSLDGRTWVKTDNSSSEVVITTPSVAVGGKVYWRGSGRRMAASSSNYSNFTSTGNFDASGNILSVLFGDDFASATSFALNYALLGLFKGNTKLIHANGITMPPFANMEGSFFNLFADCTNLVSIPDLPASTISSYAYYNLCSNCTSLASLPTISATSMTGRYGCYRMFYNCTSLTGSVAINIQVNPNSGSDCQQGFYEMFRDCTGITSATITTTGGSPILFEGCFRGCTSLTTINYTTPTTIANRMFRYMCYGCTSLVSTFALNATTLATQCYESMYKGCTSLTTASQILATTLADSCCQEMYGGCTSLTTAPDLLSTTLVNSCYKWMFYGCTNLNYVKCLATSISATDCTKQWLYNVASSGTFEGVEGVAWSRGANGIPSGWSRAGDYLCMTALESGTFTFTIAADMTVANTTSVSYSTDKTNWTTLTNVANQGVSITTPTIAANSKVYWKGTALRLAVASSGNVTTGCSFSSTGSYKLSGSLVSMLQGDNITANITGSTTQEFAGLFIDNTKLTDISKLTFPSNVHNYAYTKTFMGCTALTNAATTLPATTMAVQCYWGMFNGCTGLVNAPTIAGTTTAGYCCYQMFYGCTSLVTPPTLLPTSLTGTYVFAGMFRGCTSLTSAPALPATTLTNNCYNQMFYGCSLLETAPDLPAATLTNSCYYQMFYRCSKLNYVKCLATDISATNCLSNWLYSVASSGTFVKSTSATWTTTGASGVPNGWTVQTAAA